MRGEGEEGVLGLDRAHPVLPLPRRRLVDGDSLAVLRVDLARAEEVSTDGTSSDTVTDVEGVDRFGGTKVADRLTSDGGSGRKRGMSGSAAIP